MQVMRPGYESQPFILQAKSLTTQSPPLSPKGPTSYMLAFFLILNDISIKWFV